jgi:antitoxin YefM
MQSISVNQFRDHLKTYIDRSISNHEPVKVTRRGGEDFVVMSYADWQQEQETLYVLQNQSLMQQIAQSIATFNAKAGYQPSATELDALLSV